MIDGPPLLEEPFAQTLSGKKHLIIRYTTFSVSLFRIFRFERSDQLAVIVFCRSSQTPATIVAAIEPACYTSLKMMKLRDFTPQIAVSPTARGGWLWRATGWSPPAADVEPFGA